MTNPLLLLLPFQSLQKPWWLICWTALLSQLIQRTLFQVLTNCAVLSPSHQGALTVLPSLHWPCSAQWEWQESVLHTLVQPNLLHIGKFPLNRLTWLPHSMVHSSAGNLKRYICIFYYNRSLLFQKHITMTKISVYTYIQKVTKTSSMWVNVQRILLNKVSIYLYV